MQHAPRNTQTIALMSILTALCLAVQLSPRPPNVEFTSLFTFITGFLYGSLIGITFGSLVMFVNGFLSPWGLAGLNMPFQMIGMAIVGFAGGLYRKRFHPQGLMMFCVEAAILGSFLTELYDLITNFGVALSYMLTGINPTVAILTALAYGAPFSIIHVFSNILVFGCVFLPLIKTLNAFRVVNVFGCK